MSVKQTVTDFRIGLELFVIAKADGLSRSRMGKFSEVKKCAEAACRDYRIIADIADIKREHIQIACALAKIPHFYEECDPDALNSLCDALYEV